MPWEGPLIAVMESITGPVARIVSILIIVATGLTLSIATMWGFLENLGLVPHVDAFYIAILWFGGLGVGACYNRLTLGDSGQC